jgi:hypothetical protein
LSPETSFRLPPNPPDLEGPRRVIAGARPARRDAARGPGIRPDLSKRRLRVSGFILISPRTAASSRDTARCGGTRRSREGFKASSGDAAPAPAGLRRRRGNRGRSPGIHAGVPGRKLVSPDTRRCRRIWRTVCRSRDPFTGIGEGVAESGSWRETPARRRERRSVAGGARRRGDKKGGRPKSPPTERTDLAAAKSRGRRSGRI